MFYKNDDLISDSGWLQANQSIIYKSNQILIATLIDTDNGFGPNNHSHQPLLYAFDFEGNIIYTKEIPFWTKIIEKVENLPLFYYATLNESYESMSLHYEYSVVELETGNIIEQFNKGDVKGDIFNGEYINGQNYSITISFP